MNSAGGTAKYHCLYTILKLKIRCRLFSKCSDFGSYLMKRLGDEDIGAVRCCITNYLSHYILTNLRLDLSPVFIKQIASEVESGGILLEKYWFGLLELAIYHGSTEAALIISAYIKNNIDSIPKIARLRFFMLFYRWWVLKHNTRARSILDLPDDLFTYLRWLVPYAKGSIYEQRLQPKEAMRCYRDALNKMPKTLDLYRILEAKVSVLETR